MTFWVHLLSRHIMLLRSSVLLHLSADSAPCIVQQCRHSTCIHLLVDRSWDCFQDWAIMNDAASWCLACHVILCVSLLLDEQDESPALLVPNVLERMTASTPFFYSKVWFPIGLHYYSCIKQPSIHNFFNDFVKSLDIWKLWYKKRWKVNESQM